MPDPPPRFGAGRFELAGSLRPRSTGGVFLARDLRVGDACALKLLDEEAVPEEALHRFEAEARVLCALRHPHLVPARAAGRDHGFRWFAMDLLEGGSLQDLVRDRGRVPAAPALVLAFQVLMGLRALHRFPMVHRDVKLSNVLLDAEGRARLTDLGIAQHPEGTLPFTTHTGQELGTQGYIAPEQHEDPATVGPAADLFSTGVLLYRLLTRRPPHRLHLGHYRPVLLEEVPAPIRGVLLRSTQVEPEDRHRDAEAMARAVAEAHDALVGGTEAERWMAALRAPGTVEPWGPLRGWLG